MLLGFKTELKLNNKQLTQILKHCGGQLHGRASRLEQTVRLGSLRCCNWREECCQVDSELLVDKKEPSPLVEARSKQQKSSYT